MKPLDTFWCPECKAPARLVDITDGPRSVRVYQAVTVEHMSWCTIQPDSPRYLAAVEKLRASLTARQHR